MKNHESENVKYSVIVPCVCGRASLVELTQRMKQVFSTDSYEIVFVVDGGEDATWETVRELAKSDPLHVRGYRLTRNFGQHNATLCGIGLSRGEWIVSIDEDLQHAPEDIRHLVHEQVREDFDVVYGSPLAAEHGVIRKLMSRALRRLLRNAMPELHSAYSSFRLIRGSIARRALEMNNARTFIDGYLAWITDRVSSVAVSHYPRREGRSAYTTRGLIAHSLNILVTFSSLPIRLVTVSSVTLFVLSLLYAGYLAFRRVVYEDLLPGYASTIIMTGVGFGLVLLALGIIGEYIYRINLKTTRKPNFLVREEAMSAPPSPGESAFL